jgi:hypothetical protein
MKTIQYGLVSKLILRRISWRSYDTQPSRLVYKPVASDQVGLRRILSTTALSATFPFTGTDLPARDGVLYGINTITRSPLVVDRFALANHNAVVFATSGAGKSFLVKVELIRAMLAGTRAVVIDPEGEHAELIAALGGRVVTIKSGSGAGLDPFAHHDSSRGALDTRIATVTVAGQCECGRDGVLDNRPLPITRAAGKQRYEGELPPGALAAPRRWRQAMAAQHSANGQVGAAMTQLQQLTLDSAIAPASCWPITAADLADAGGRHRP